MSKLGFVKWLGMIGYGSADSSDGLDKSIRELAVRIIPSRRSATLDERGSNKLGLVFEEERRESSNLTKQVVAYIGLSFTDGRLISKKGISIQ